MATFELILEQGEPVAALISPEITDKQLWIIYCMLPHFSYCHWQFKERWKVERVLATDEWAHAQLRRKPMFKPRGIKLQFL